MGTEGGGMDQAVSVMAQQGLALHVEFEPVRGACAGAAISGHVAVGQCS